MSTIDGAPKQGTSSPSQAEAQGEAQAEAQAEETSETRPTGAALRRFGGYFSVTNIGVLYVEILLVVVFSFAAPHTFFTSTTLHAVLNEMALPGLMALALVVPLSTRTFDLSIGGGMTLANIVVAWLLVSHGWGLVPAMLATLACGLLMGLLNGVVVVGARIDSFIGTMATGALFVAVVEIISTQSISGTQIQQGSPFANIAYDTFLGLNWPLWITLAVALLLWYFQRYTVTGRRMYAVGFNQRGSQLVGISTGRLKFLALIVAGVVVALAAMLATSTFQTGDPNLGGPYLLDAYAAAFLGSTQFGGRFNAWGTLLAVLMISTGLQGITLVASATWPQDMFRGVVLLLALGSSNLEAALRARLWVRAKARSTARS